MGKKKAPIPPSTGFPVPCRRRDHAALMKGSKAQPGPDSRLHTCTGPHTARRPTADWNPDPPLHNCPIKLRNKWAAMRLRRSPRQPASRHPPCPFNQGHVALGHRVTSEKHHKWGKRARVQEAGEAGCKLGQEGPELGEFKKKQAGNGRCSFIPSCNYPELTHTSELKKFPIKVMTYSDKNACNFS